MGISVYAFAVYLVTLMAFVPDLRGDEFFKTITTLVVGTAFVNGVVSWAFGATKNGGELAQKQADTLAARANDTPAGTATDPLNVKDVQP